ncbi:hypothetical protein HDV03_004928 [Kappamyces sp. JEL0829]|nr:hypothetical protein HDV03_004928 [Kappamyces sp. JEL0829]
MKFQFKRAIHYTVLAKDFPNGLQRRLANRVAHLDRAAELKTTGFVLLGGATLDETTKEMNGSFLLIDAPNREAVEKYILSDPYVKGRVWESWQINEFKIGALSPHLK